MDLNLSPEQTLLKAAADRFIAERYSFAARTGLAATTDGFSSENWRRFAQMGWLALGLPEQSGGFPDADVELMILGEAFGRGLVIEPFYSSVVVAGTLLRVAGDDAQNERWTSPIASGYLKFAFAYDEPGIRADKGAFRTRCVRESGGYRVHGRKAVVMDAPSAALVIIAACDAADGAIRLLVTPKDVAGLTIQSYRTTDGRRAGEIELANVFVAEAGMLQGDAEAAIGEAYDRMVAVSCADAVGAMDALLQLTLEHLKTRKQFGAAIGSFQALQHRMADLFVALELARSMAIYATLSLNEPPPARAKAVSLAKIQVIDAAQRIGRQAVQLHGGMGMTTESPVGHYFKRLIAFETLYGNADQHAERVESP